MKTSIRGQLALLLLMAGAVACGGRRDERTETTESPSTQAPEGGGTLTIKGSDTMVILAQRWAEEFMRRNPGTTIQVSGGGSGTGIAALINGTTDLANASRAMNDRERGNIQSERSRSAVEYRVALDALAVYVHVSNSVQSLTIPQLKQIYRGEVTNWNQVGGNDHPIVLYSRENNSGTYAYFKEHVLEDLDFAPQAQTLPGTAAVINAVSHDEHGIGYGGIAYSQGVRALRIAPADGEALEPTMENATSGRYPLARFLHIYAAGEPTGPARAYLDFVLSSEGQQIVEGVGFYPLPRNEAPPTSATPTGQ